MVLRLFIGIVQRIGGGHREHWEDEMRRRGFRRLYDKCGNNFWVSSWYSERCESILDEDGKRMYWTREGWEVEVGSKSPRGSSINAIRKLKG